jgi:hypothetical protein
MQLLAVSNFAGLPKPGKNDPRKHTKQKFYSCDFV